MLEFLYADSDKKYMKVYVGSEDNYAGDLHFDEDQKVWIFDWGDDVMEYDPNLDETMREMQQDYDAGLRDENITLFGNYEYPKFDPVLAFNYRHDDMSIFKIKNWYLYPIITESYQNIKYFYDKHNYLRFDTYYDYLVEYATSLNQLGLTRINVDAFKKKYEVLTKKNIKQEKAAKRFLADLEDIKDQMVKACQQNAERYFVLFDLKKFEMLSDAAKEKDANEDLVAINELVANE